MSYELADVIVLAANEFVNKMSFVGANGDWRDWRTEKGNSGFHNVHDVCMTCVTCVMCEHRAETAVNVVEHGSVFGADSHVNWRLTGILSDSYELEAGHKLQEFWLMTCPSLLIVVFKSFKAEA